MLYLFDKDGTLTETFSGKPCPNSTDDMFLLPNVQAVLADLNSGCLANSFGIVTNQGGVSFGYMTELRAWEIIVELNKKLNNIFDIVKMSPYKECGKFARLYEKSTSAKPSPESIQAILEELESPAEETVFIGDSFIDEEAANTACVRFVWANEFFSWPKESLCENNYGVRWKREALTKYLLGE